MNKKCIIKPDFIGIGAAKSGTTWIAHCLEEHPEILLSTNNGAKELNFFNTEDISILGSYVQKNNNLGIDWYLSNFSNSKNFRICGEFSVSYLCDPNAPKRIKDLFPNTKLIICLRNPIDMLISLYSMVSNSLDIRVSKKIDEEVLSERFLIHAKYGNHIKNFLEYFELENICIIFFDDIRKNPEGTMKKIYTFLDVDSHFVPRLLHEKRGISMETRSRLLKNFLGTFLSVLKIFFGEGFLNKLKRSSLLYDSYMYLNLVPRDSKPVIQKATRVQIQNILRDDIAFVEKLTKRSLKEWYEQ